MLSAKSKSLVLKILFTSTNILFCLTDIKGTVVFWTSVGAQKQKGAKKVTSTSVEIVLNYLFKEIKGLGCNYLHVQQKGFNKNKKLILRFFKQAKIEILSIYDQTSLPHNGCKLRKIKRI
uniref:Ribosomal protein S11 n=1 Tax=Gelidium elegans TaxID=37200 RepID=A0A0A6ZIX1_GELEL|nr:ribosomal protein S11 [Gelidium elegans]AGW30465.1 ribosomal protein S11 [Gelidium elegans]